MGITEVLPKIRASRGAGRPGAAAQGATAGGRAAGRRARLQPAAREAAQGAGRAGRLVRQPDGLGLAREPRARHRARASTACCAFCRSRRTSTRTHGVARALRGEPGGRAAAAPRPPDEYRRALGLPTPAAPRAAAGQPPLGDRPHPADAGRVARLIAQRSRAQVVVPVAPGLARSRSTGPFAAAAWPRFDRRTRGGGRRRVRRGGRRVGHRDARSGADAAAAGRRVPGRTA